MDAQIRKEKNTVVVSLKGRMDAITAPQFDAMTADWVANQASSFLINFSGLDYVSSAGLRSILALAKKLKPIQGQVFFAGLHGSVEEVFKISGFLSIFKAYPSEEAALKEI